MRPAANPAFFFTGKAPRAVVLTAHGLNTRPGIMLPLITWLQEKGCDAFLLKLYGHHEGSGPFAELQEGRWQQEFEAGYRQARERARALRVPLYFIGYSLGALVGQYAMFSEPGRVSFDKQVLLAPAIALRSRTYLLKGLFFLPGSWAIPSKAPDGYRANRRTPLQAYKILFAQQRRIRNGCFQHLNIPSLIIVDPQDELISLRKLRKYKAEFGLDNYHILELDPEEGASYHHLIVDEWSMGRGNWKVARAAMGRFFGIGG